MSVTCHPFNHFTYDAPLRPPHALPLPLYLPSASLDGALSAKSRFESALEDIGRQRESDKSEWRESMEELEERMEELEKEKSRLANDNDLLRSISKGSSSARLLEESDRR